MDETHRQDAPMTNKNFYSLAPEVAKDFFILNSRIIFSFSASKILPMQV